MPRLIDADELKTAFPCGESVRTESVRATIDHMPTVDAVEVVRCKDCKFYWKNNRDSDGVVCLASPKDDAFCSEGERREDGQIN